MARMECAASSTSAGTSSNITPPNSWPEANTSGLRLAATMSACRVSAQNPGSAELGIRSVSAGRCQDTGRSARSRANTSSRAAGSWAQNACEEMSNGSKVRVVGTGPASSVPSLQPDLDHNKDYVIVNWWWLSRYVELVTAEEGCRC